MRILSVDWGEARIGLALSDPTGTLASPLTTLHEKDKRAQIERVVELQLNASEKKMLDKSAGAVRGLVDICKKLQKAGQSKKK